MPSERFSSSTAGYASSARDRREIAVGVNQEIHLYVATGTGSFIKQQDRWSSTSR